MADGSVGMDDMLLQQLLQQMEDENEAESSTEDSAVDKAAETMHNPTTGSEGEDKPSKEGQGKETSAQEETPTGGDKPSGREKPSSSGSGDSGTGGTSSVLAELLRSMQGQTGGSGRRSVGVVEETGSRPKHNFIVAIDLGTKYSGYAFQQTSIQASDRKEDDITPFVNWGGGAVYNNYKTPTCILLNADASLVAFGQESIDRYIDLDKTQQDDALFFELFKMTLYSEVQREGKLEKNYHLTARNGKTLPALKVFGQALRHLKEHFYEMIETRVGFEVEQKEVLWVVTVPAIWDDSAKNFMREAAYEGELVTSNEQERLIIALEPEAAALHCRSLTFSGFHDGTASGNYDPPKPGDRYLVVDAGGGTVDITCHEIVNPREVKEVEKATGGAHGGSQVDENFLRLLERVFDKEFIQEVWKRDAPELVQVMQNFEVGKRKCGFKDYIDRAKSKDDSTKSDGLEKVESPLTVALPFDFCQLYAHNTGKHPKDAIRAFNNKSVVWRGGCMKLSLDEAKSLFDPVIGKIIEVLKTLLAKPHLHGVKTIYLVGGFSDCPLMRYEVKSAFPDKRVLVPVDAGLAVVKGAVRFARDPTVVSERIMRHTYGTDVADDFITGIHPESRKIRLNGKDHCSGVFSPFVTAGQSVKFGETIERGYIPTNKLASTFHARIYASPHSRVEYCDDEGCQEITTISVRLPPDSKVMMMEDRPCRLIFNFASTELKVTAVDVLSGESRQTSVSFLSG